MHLDSFHAAAILFNIDGLMQKNASLLHQASAVVLDLVLYFSYCV